MIQGKYDKNFGRFEKLSPFFAEEQLNQTYH